MLQTLPFEDIFDASVTYPSKAEKFRVGEDLLRPGDIVLVEGKIGRYPPKRTSAADGGVKEGETPGAGSC